jgi:mRNA interferase MazF
VVTPQIGSVILIPFPFSDLTSSKLRPARILATAGRDDWVCLQITSRAYADNAAIKIDNTDFSAGSLQRPSFARPGKLFTAHQSLFQRIIGQISQPKLEEIRNAVITLVKTGYSEPRQT